MVPRDFQALAAGRAARARLLADRYPASREVLLFFAEIAVLQQRLAARLPQPRTRPKKQRGFALDQLLDGRTELVALVLEKGPELLREQARHFDEAACRQSLRKWFTGQDTTSPHSFFARVLLQPVMYGWDRSASGESGKPVDGRNAVEVDRSVLPRDAGLGISSGGKRPQLRRAFELSMAGPSVPEAGIERGAATCPHCGHPPQAGCLRPQGDGAAMSLVCSLCLAEWPFSRLCCPACGQSDHHKIVFYSSAEFAHLEVQVCDSCTAYLHVVHLEKDKQAIPDVDELAALPLDVWARDKGYHKLQPNLAGI